MEGEDINGHQNTRGNNPQTGGGATTDPNRHLGPKKRSPRKRKDTAQNPEAPRPLLEDSSLKGEMRDTTRKG